MRLIDDYGISILQRAGEIPGPASTPPQVGVVIDEQVDETASQVGKISLQQRLPHVLPGGLRSKQCNALFLLHDEALHQHQSDEALTQADPIADKSGAE